MSVSRLTIRQQREWSRKLLAKLEAVEKATDDLHAEMQRASEAGLSAYAISRPINMAQETVKKILDSANDAG